MNGPQRASKSTQIHPTRHVPQRMCVVCRTSAAKRTLTRLVRVVEDSADAIARVQIDPTGKRSGRGAYLCDQPSCWQLASDSDVLAKALRMTLSDADRLLLRANFPAAGNEPVASTNTKPNPMAPPTPQPVVSRQ